MECHTSQHEDGGFRSQMQDEVCAQGNYYASRLTAKSA